MCNRSLFHQLIKLCVKVLFSLFHQLMKLASKSIVLHLLKKASFFLNKMVENKQKMSNLHRLHVVDLSEYDLIQKKVKKWVVFLEKAELEPILYCEWLMAKSLARATCGIDGLERLCAENGIQCNILHLWTWCVWNFHCASICRSAKAQVCDSLNTTCPYDPKTLNAVNTSHNGVVKDMFSSEGYKGELCMAWLCMHSTAWWRWSESNYQAHWVVLWQHERN